MSDWTSTRLGDAVEYIKNGTTATQLKIKSPKLVTRIETIADGEVNLSKVGFVAESENIERYRLTTGDILFSHINSIKHIGKTALIRSDDELYNGMNLLQIRPSRARAYPFFLLEVLRSDDFRSEVRSRAKQAVNQASISIAQLQELEIFLPPLPEQKKIAEILSGIDQCIWKQQHKIDAVAAFLENVSSQLLENISEDNSTHHKRIDEVSTLKGGNGFPIEHQGVTHGGTPFIKVSDFNNPGNENEIKTANNYVSKESMSSLRPHVFPVNTIVFAKVGAALTSNRRRILSMPTCIDNNLMGAIPKEIEPLYLKLLFEKIDFNQFCQDGAVPSVNQSQIGCIEVPVPSTEKQKQAVLVTESFRAMSRTLEVKKEKLVALKNALSSDLLSGRKRVSV